MTQTAVARLRYEEARRQLARELKAWEAAFRPQETTHGHEEGRTDGRESARGAHDARRAERGRA